MNLLPPFRISAGALVLAASLSACMDAPQAPPGKPDGRPGSGAESEQNEEYWRTLRRDQARLERGEDVCGVRYTGLRPGVPLDVSEEELRRRIPIEHVRVIFEPVAMILLINPKPPRLMTVQHDENNIVTAIFCGHHIISPP